MVRRICGYYEDQKTVEEKQNANLKADIDLENSVLLDNKKHKTRKTIN